MLRHKEKGVSINSVYNDLREQIEPKAEEPESTVQDEQPDEPEAGVAPYPEYFLTNIGNLGNLFAGFSCCFRPIGRKQISPFSTTNPGIGFPVGIIFDEFDAGNGVLANISNLGNLFVGFFCCFRRILRKQFSALSTSNPGIGFPIGVFFDEFDAGNGVFANVGNLDNLLACLPITLRPIGRRVVFLSAIHSLKSFFRDFRL